MSPTQPRTALLLGTLALVLAVPASTWAQVPAIIDPTAQGLPSMPQLPVATLPDGTPLPPAVGSLIAWCNQVVPVLGRAQALAMTHTFAGREREAIRTLVVGMEQALNMTTVQGRRRTMSGRLLDRGIQIVRGMQADFPTEDALSPLLNFTSSWVNMVIRVASDLDRPYYIPYANYYQGVCGVNCGGLPYFDYAEFQRRYLSAVSEQLTLITDTLANGYAPLGSPAFFLRATQRILTPVVNEDLSQSLYAYNYSCIAAGLLALVQEISAGFGYPDQVQLLVWRVINTLRDVGPLFASYSCGPSYAQPGYGGPGYGGPGYGGGYPR